jgi:hypothetical protein
LGKVLVLFSVSIMTSKNKNQKSGQAYKD